MWFLSQLTSRIGALTEVQTSSMAYLACIAGLAFGALMALLFQSRARRPERQLTS